MNKYAKRAAQKKADVIPEHIHPQMLRHSRAMHLLQSGVNLIYIRDILGHVAVTTTEIYARADDEAKRRAIEAASPYMHNTVKDWEENSKLLDLLRYMG